MKVLAHMTFTTTILVEVPDDIPEKDQQSKACELADQQVLEREDFEWALSDFYRPAKEGEESYDTLEDGTKMTEWFDVG